MSALEDRYASGQMLGIWSLERRMRLEREAWVTVMELQQEEVGIPQEAVDAARRAAMEPVDVGRVALREAATGHDIKARLEEFCRVAGHEYAHLGLTSHDITDIVDLALIRSSLELLIMKSEALLWRMRAKCLSDDTTPMVARTHNVPAQVTTPQRRMAMWAQETLRGYGALVRVLKGLPDRGRMNGAIGTGLDAAGLGIEIGIHMENRPMFGQHYPRSYDFEVGAAVLQACMGPGSFATTMRLMAGVGLAGEGRGPGYVGSSAMPHKHNATLSERVCGLLAVLRGFVFMLADVGGGQWNEGDVSTSSTRRVALPEMMMAADAILDTTIVLIEHMWWHWTNIHDEVGRHRSEMCSGWRVMDLVRKGEGREKAHQRVAMSADPKAVDAMWERYLKTAVFIANEQARAVAEEIYYAIGQQPRDSFTYTPQEVA